MNQPQLHPQNIFQALFFLVLAIGIMVLAGDLATRSSPKVNKWYRGIVKSLWNGIKTHVQRFLYWAWREHKKFLFGAAAGVLATLWILGRLG